MALGTALTTRYPVGAFARDGNNVFGDVVFVRFRVAFCFGNRIGAAVLSGLFRRIVGGAGAYKGVAFSTTVWVWTSVGVHFLHDAASLHCAFSNGGRFDSLVPVHDHRCAMKFRVLFLRGVRVFLRRGDLATRVSDRFRVYDAVAGGGAIDRVVVANGVFSRRSYSELANERVIFQGATICRSVVGGSTFPLRYLRRRIIRQPGNVLEGEEDARTILVNGRRGFGIRFTTSGSRVAGGLEVGLRFVREVRLMIGQ